MTNPPGASPEDIERISLAIQELRDQVAELQVKVDGVARAVGWQAPVEPALPPLPVDVAEMVEKGERQEAVLQLARERGTSAYSADQELKSHGL